MAYVKFHDPWGSGSCCGEPGVGQPDTPITKGACNHWEDGIFNAAAAADAAQVDATQALTDAAAADANANNRVLRTGDTMTGTLVNTEIAGVPALIAAEPGDTGPRWVAFGDGRMAFGNGAGVIDPIFTRVASNWVDLAGGTISATQVVAFGTFAAGETLTTDRALRVQINGEVDQRLIVLGDGSLHWGDGTNPVDTDLFRSSAGVLRTSSQFSINKVGLATDAELRLSRDAGHLANIRMRTGLLDRWGIQTSNDAESGANGGSNLNFQRFDDAGVLIGNVMNMTRSTGVVMITTPGVANGAVVSVDGTQPLTNKTYAGFGATATTINMTQRVTGDTSVRWAIDASGTQTYTPGAGAVDCTWKRAAAGILQALDCSVQSQRSLATLVAHSAIVAADTNNRWQVTAGGVSSYGPGNAAVDTSLQRAAAGTLELVPTSGAGQFTIRAASAGNNAVVAFNTNTTLRWAIGKNATAEGGANAGSDFVIVAYTDAGAVASTPVTITRSTGTVSTAAALLVGTALRVVGNVGFYNTAPVAKPTVTGSRGGNAALASLLTALASQGLLTDSSTA